MDGIVLGETEMDDDEIKIVNENIEGGSGSTVSKLTSTDVKFAIEKNGMSVDEFSKLLDPNRIWVNYIVYTKMRNIKLK